MSLSLKWSQSLELTLSILARWRKKTFLFSVTLSLCIANLTLSWKKKHLYLLLIISLIREQIINLLNTPTLQLLSKPSLLLLLYTSLPSGSHLNARCSNKSTNRLLHPKKLRCSKNSNKREWINPNKIKKLSHHLTLP